MPLDFSKINATSTADTLVKPREIFAALPSKDPKKYKYLRDVQAEVLDQWHSRRTTKDVRLKMNTGGGKTLVGLLMLKSCLNEGQGPVVYVAPTPYLASQVEKEAAALGLAFENDPRAPAVGRGKAILITHIHVLLNGKSKFGVGTEEIPIGSFVLDDAHACLSTAEQQFTLKVLASNPVYDELFQLFRPDLEAQSSMGLIELEQQDPSKLMLVPFWAWLDKVKKTEGILNTLRDERNAKFTWPLLHNHLRQCRCVFGAGQVEISPRCLPVEVIPSFVRAKRRVFMSATFADDSVLVTDFDATPADIKVAIAPTSASDIGDRMILVPQALDPTIADEDIRGFAAGWAKHLNVVVIVPSAHRAETFWGGVANLTLTADNLESGVEQLKNGRVGLVVIVNKYDGIDLPDEACRLLILDGIPDARRSIDQVEQSQLHGTPLQVGKAMQVIEQGMGRGVRANDDYCVVLLMGRSLTGHLFTRNGVEQLTPATRAQFDLSEQVGQQIKGKGVNEIANAANYLIGRDADWVRAAKSALAHVTYATASSDLEVAVARRQAFSSAAAGDYSKAVALIQEQANKATDSLVKGWLQAELAEYTHPINVVTAQQIQRSAHAANRQLIRPREGIDYQRLAPLSGEQAATCVAYLRNRFKLANELVIAANAVAEDLIFKPETFKRFHRAICEAAFMLGFAGQLPESEYGAGPDAIWAVGNLRYFVIECKNGAITDTVNKHDCNQLAGSANWFLEKYDRTCSGTPVMIHPSSVFERASTPPPNTRVMTSTDLPRFKEAFLTFCVAVSRLNQFGSAKEVAPLLSAHHLLPDSILASYTTAVTKQR